MILLVSVYTRYEAVAESLLHRRWGPLGFGPPLIGQCREERISVDVRMCLGGDGPIGYIQCLALDLCVAYDEYGL